MNEPFQLLTLGRLELYAPDGSLLASEAKPLLVLALLGMEHRHTASRDHVAELLWQEADLPRRQQSLRQALYTLRQLGADDVVILDGERLVLDRSRIRLDVWEVQERLDAERYEEVTELFDGRFLEPMEGKVGPELGRWIEAEDTRLGVALDQAFRRAIEREMAGGDPGRATGLAKRWVGYNPLSEERVRLLLEVLLASGHALEALQEARRFRKLLDLELCDQPSPAFDVVEEKAWAVASRSAEDRAVGVEGERRGAVSETGIRTRIVRWGPGLALVVVASLVLVRVGGSRVPGEMRLPAGHGGTVGELVIASTDVIFRPSARNDVPGSVASPVRNESAGRSRAPGGTDVVLVDSAGTRTVILDSPADEHPMDWSPDGERLAYSRGWYDSIDGGYRVTLGLWDRRRRAQREFPMPGFDGRLQANWSPDGSRIAIGGGPRLVLLDPRGETLAAVEPGGFVGVPMWSPDGGRLATTVWEGRPADVYLLGQNGDRLERLVRTPGHEVAVTWLDERFLLAVSRMKGRNHLVVLDAERRRAALLSEEDSPVEWFGRGEGVSLRGSATLEALLRPFLERAGEDARHFVDSLHVDGPRGPLSPGEYAIYTMTPYDGAGRPVLLVQTEPEWSARNDRVQALGGGIFRARRPGRDTIRVAYSGWRSSDVAVRVAAPKRRNLEATFREDWSGAWQSRWVTFGDPVPVVEVLAEPQDPESAVVGEHVLDPSGDQNYASGVQGRRLFSTAKGITLEWWASADFTGAKFQTWAVGLVRSMPDRFPDNYDVPYGVSWVWLLGSGEGVRMQGLNTTYRVPLPDSMSRWTKYALQVSPSGEQVFLVDGRVYHRTRLPENWSRGDSVSIVLSGQAVDTRVQLGPLEVFEGEVYDLRR